MFANTSVNPPIVAVFALLALAGCGGDKAGPAPVQVLPSATTLPAPTPVASDGPVILLYEAGFGGLAGDPPAQPLEVAVWGDGRIVWRQNNALFQARIDSHKVDELVQRLHREGVFGSGTVEYRNYGPDSAFHVVEVRLPDRTLRLESWHERFEQDPELVVTSHGVEALEGRRREAVLAAEPSEYQRFRRVWSDIRSTVESWIPSEGQPFPGAVPVGRGG